MDLRRGARALGWMTMGAVIAIVVPLLVPASVKRVVDGRVEALGVLVAHWVDDSVLVTRGAFAGAEISELNAVIDGDTLDVGGARVRLYGIDAPERGQRCSEGGRMWPCGEEAARALGVYVGARAVVCESRVRTGPDMVVALCRIEGEDVGAWLVSAGWALAYREVTQDYVGAEEVARGAGRGVWRGEIVAPWDWRRGVRLVGEM